MSMKTIIELFYNSLKKNPDIERDAMFIIKITYYHWKPIDMFSLTNHKTIGLFIGLDEQKLKSYRINKVLKHLK